MKEEIWLKKIKNRLDDYSEPLPISGWERLEQELSAPVAPVAPKRVPLYRRWSVAAAAALLLGVSSISIWLMQSPLRNEIQQVSQVAKVLGPVSGVEEFSHSTTVSEPSSTFASTSSPAKKVSVRRSTVACCSDSATSHSVSPDTQVLLEHNQEVPVVSSRDAAAEEVVDHGVSARTRERYRPSNRDKFHLSENSSHSASSGRWSLALAVANTGGFSSFGSQADATMMPYDAGVLSSEGIFDLSATSNGILNIPEGQELNFKNGIPYLSGRNKQVASINHKLPISVGFSVRKQLSKGFSFETGLVYSYLASDVTMVGGEEMKQKLHYVGIPLRANWAFWQHDRLELYVAGGGMVEKCVYGKLGTSHQTVKPLQFSVMGSVGAQLNLSQKIGVYVEPGISYYFDDGSYVQTIRKENPCNFTLQGGIRFTY